jgi:hypothetical protein
MTAPRIYLANDALTGTAFPLSDDIGYVVRVGDGDQEGVYLGSVFHEGQRWVAYAPAGAEGRSETVGSSSDLDELVTECFLKRMRLTDDSGW